MNEDMIRRDVRREIDFDQHSPVHVEESIQAFRGFRQTAPVAWSASHGGFWLLSAYRDVFAALRDPTTFSSARTIGADGSLGGGIAIPSLPFRLMPTESDLPE